jgi:hypothetical protein
MIFPISHQLLATQQNRQLRYTSAASSSIYIYVTLSRVGDWEEMAILRPFEDSVLQTRPDEELLEYEEILKHMDLETQRRVAADFA